MFKLFCAHFFSFFREKKFIRNFSSNTYSFASCVHSLTAWVSHFFFVCFSCFAFCSNFHTTWCVYLFVFSVYSVYTNKIVKSVYKLKKSWMNNKSIQTREGFIQKVVEIRFVCVCENSLEKSFAKNSDNIN